MRHRGRDPVRRRDADVAAVARISEACTAAGPDGTGVHATGRVALGHRRLKIIDLSERGAQPMVDAELGLTPVFNGCIYNYRELRDELEGPGYRFFSTPDTEVMLKAYHRWGTACVEHFYGMFAFAIAERDTGVLTLGRDRLGIKPLYLTRTPAGCGSPRPCRRCSRPATSTPRSTRWRCTTT